MLNLAPITSTATLKLIIYKMLELDGGLSDTDLCRELGISQPSLWRARQALTSLDLSPARPTEPVEEMSFEQEAASIDAIEATGRVGQHRTGADIRRRRLRQFIPQVWKSQVPTGERFTKEQIDDLAKVAEQSSEAPAALILDKINTFALMHADRVKTTHYRYLRAMLLNKPRTPRPALQPKRFEPLPGEATTVEEARAEQARISREWVEKNRPQGPVTLSFMIDEEDEDG